MIEITKRDGPSTYQSDAMIAVQSANRIRDRRDDKINRARYPHTYPSPPPFLTREFSSFGTFFTFAVYLIVDISKRALRAATCPASEREQRDSMERS